MTTVPIKQKAITLQEKLTIIQKVEALGAPLNGQFHVPATLSLGKSPQ
jgi:hypothetical protein